MMRTNFVIDDRRMLIYYDFVSNCDITTLQKDIVLTLKNNYE